MHLAPDFLPLLAGHSLEELEASENTVVGIRADYTMGYVNPAWFRFAQENAAPDLEHWENRSITQSFADPVVDAYLDLFRRVQDSGKPADHDYECSTAETYRGFRLRVLPLPARALLLLHHLRVERPHDRAVAAPEDLRYRDDQGVITQCAHCRRTRRSTNLSTWDWVPAYLDRSLRDVSHGLCPTCFRHYYPRAASTYDYLRR